MDTTNLKCQVCSGVEFTDKEGFYYCLECGTQTEQMRDVQVEVDDQQENKQLSKLKIKKDDTLNTLELTTWECFNYYLKGLVEELINLGAKEELRLTTLQLWTTFLRKNEVAFFNTKQNQLPKLGPCYNAKDAKILYNHKVGVKKVKKETQTVMTGRGAWSRQKRKFAKSEYEASQSATSISILNSSLSKLSSSTATTGRAARLNFTDTARKHFKANMSSGHLKKHEMDDQNELSCHQLSGKKLTLQRKIRDLQLNRKTIYTLLYIALNLIEDDIQLSDMLRFLHEGHLSITKISHFFPENIAENCEKLTNSREFTSKRNIFLDSQIRGHCVQLCKFLYIPELKTPNLVTLIHRYCIDFSLPNDIFLYAERMINLSAPEIKFRFQMTTSPYYEARALAYIIFILKLLFGLDDNKENTMSNSAKLINNKLQELQLNKQQLFVWNDWVKYIEMRKIILAQCHSTTINQYKNINHDHYIERLENEDKCTDEDVLKFKRNNIQNLNRIFDKFIGNKKPFIQLTEFRNTLTPQSDYLKAILKDPPNSIYIPEYLEEDHTIKDVHSFINPKKLKTHLKNDSINLKCIKIDCTENRFYYNTFSCLHQKERRKHYRDVSVRKIDFNIDEIEWLEQVKNNNCSEKFDFLTPRTKVLENCYEENKRTKKTVRKKINLENSIDNVLVIDNNLQINQTDILKPRRNLENENIFDGLSDDNLTDDDNDDENHTKLDLTLHISSLSYWILFGKMQRLNELQFSEVKKKFPLNFVWLIETFSQYLNIDEDYLYEELLTLENHFIYVLDNMENVKDMLLFKSEHVDKELARLIDHYKLRW